MYINFNNNISIVSYSFNLNVYEIFDYIVINTALYNSVNNYSKLVYQCKT